MQIQRFDSGSPLRNRPATVQRTDAETSGAGQVAGSGIGTSRGTGELRELSSRVAAVPDVRPDVVEASRMKLQQGDYMTRAAAEKTADAILSEGA